MNNYKWTESEKKIARKAFRQAFQREFATLLASFKQKSLSVSEPEDLWALGDFIASARKEMERKYDYRYSMLDIVFGILLSEGWLLEEDLSGIGEDKMEPIRRLAQWRKPKG